jgi:hypothetical protein
MSMGLESQTTVPTVNGLSLNQMATTGTVGHSEKTYRLQAWMCTGGVLPPSKTSPAQFQQNSQPWAQAPILTCHRGLPESGEFEILGW